MLLPPFDYHEPTTLEQALELKADFKDAARLLAGGTDLLVHLKKGLASPEHVINLGRVKALAILEEADGFIDIGSGVTVTDLATSALIASRLPALQQGAQALGSILVRNRATIGGNINSARPAADLLPSLMVYRASLVLERVGHSREISLEDFIKGPGKTDIRSDEIMSRIRVPMPPKASGAAYIHLGKRKSQEINIVNVASCLCFDAAGVISQARISLGSVGPTPLRAAGAEAVLTGKKPDETLLVAAGEKARRSDCRPIDDFRGSADYRRAMVGILVKRTLETAWAMARNN
ncbi:MAG: xanthine dehydrogenase family protein subunit M [Pseudomonadota bacterium]